MATTHTVKPDFKLPQWNSEPKRATRRQSYPPPILRNHSTIRTEDDHRLLPPGWVRQTDPKTHKDFFVDTTTDPPYSTWRHPYDSRPHSPVARRTSMPTKKLSVVIPGTGNPGNENAIVRFEEPLRPTELAERDAAYHSDRDDYFPRHGSSEHALYDYTSGSEFADDEDYDTTPPSPGHHRSRRDPSRLRRAGTFLKDAWTESSHSERAASRARRASESEEAWRMRNLLIEAAGEARATGRPAFLMRDESDCPVYVEPPNGPAMPRDVDTQSGSWGAKNPYVWPPYTEENAKFVKVLGAEDKKSGKKLGMGLAGVGVLGALGGAAVSSATM